MSLSFCIDCDSPLTAAEVEFYDNRCERCEALWHERVKAWRQGKRADSELDGQFTIDRTTA